MDEFKINFNHCVEDKTVKIKDHHSKYNSWWLVLVDQIAHSFDENEKDEVKTMVSMNTSWDKVIVLNSLNGNNILEI